MTWQKMRGFTLMELMIAVVIVGILAAFAIPSYMSQVERSRESEGQTLITRIMQDQERYYTENLTYTNNLTDLKYSISANVESEEGYYKASASECANPTGLANCVLITGISTTGGKTLTLNSLGKKSRAGVDGWRR